MGYKLGSRGYLITRKSGTFYGSINHIAQLAVGIAEHMTTIWLKASDITAMELGNILKDVIYEIHGEPQVEKAKNNVSVNLEEATHAVKMGQREYQVLANTHIFTETKEYAEGISMYGDDFFNKHIFSGFDPEAAGTVYNDLTCLIIDSIEGLQAILRFLRKYGNIQESVNAGRIILIGSIQCKKDMTLQDGVRTLIEELGTYFSKFDVLPKKNQRNARKQFIYSYIDSMICYDWTEQDKMHWE